MGRHTYDAFRKLNGLPSMLWDEIGLQSDGRKSRRQQTTMREP
jgi:hypothetical protein